MLSRQQNTSTVVAILTDTILMLCLEDMFACCALTLKDSSPETLLRAQQVFARLHGFIVRGKQKGLAGPFDTLEILKAQLGGIEGFVIPELPEAAAATATASSVQGLGCCSSSEDEYDDGGEG